MFALRFQDGEAELPVARSVDAGEKIGEDAIALPALQAIRVLSHSDPVPPVNARLSIEIPRGFLFQFVEVADEHRLEQASINVIAILPAERLIFVAQLDLQRL